MKKNKGWAWWCHHKRLLEYCTDYAGRVAFIKKTKPKSEIPARLLAFQFSKGKLPSKLLKAYAVREKARAACMRSECLKPYRAYEKVDVAYEKIYTACLPQLAKMFCKEHPDVAWDNDKQTLIMYSALDRK